MTVSFPSATMTKFIFIYNLIMVFLNRFNIDLFIYIFIIICFLRFALFVQKQAQKFFSREL